MEKNYVNIYEMWYFFNCSTVYIYLTPLHGQDETQGQFLSGLLLVWVQSFPYAKPVAIQRLHLFPLEATYCWNCTIQLVMAWQSHICYYLRLHVDYEHHEIPNYLNHKTVFYRNTYNVLTYFVSLSSSFIISRPLFK